MNIFNLARPNIINLKPFSSARSEFSSPAEVFLDANENPFDNGVNRYPDSYQTKLKKAISRWKKVETKNIFLGNGSDEIIDLLIRVFCRPAFDRIRYMTPSFGMYEVCADINDVVKYPISLNEQFVLIPKICVANQKAQDKILFLCSPNNPTGNTIPRHDLFTILQSWRGLVVIDEAYTEFSSEPSFLDQLPNHPNLVILQTFSKAQGAAGLRIGMAFAHEDVVILLNKVKAPYNISEIAQAKALSLLSSQSIVNKQIKELIKERQKLAAEIQGMDYVLKVFPSEANFLLVKTTDPKSLYGHLVAHGIVVRDRSSQLHCDGCLRVTVGTKQENSRLVNAMKDYRLNTNT